MNYEQIYRMKTINFVGFSTAVLRVVCLLVELIDCQNMCCVKLSTFKLLSLVCRKLRFEWRCFIETIHFFPSINFARIMEENRAHLKPGVSHRFTASTALISTVAHGCHGTTKYPTAQPKTLTAQPNISRQNQISHGTTKYFTAQPNIPRHNQKLSRHNQISHGKTKYLTAQPNISRHNQITNRKTKNFHGKIK